MKICRCIRGDTWDELRAAAAADRDAAGGALPLLALVCDGPLSCPATTEALPHGLPWDRVALVAAGGVDGWLEHLLAEDGVLTLIPTDPVSGLTTGASLRLAAGDTVLHDTVTGRRIACRRVSPDWVSEVWGRHPASDALTADRP